MALTLHPRKHSSPRVDLSAVRRNTSNRFATGGSVDPALTVIGTSAAAVPQSLHWGHSHGVGHRF